MAYSYANYTGTGSKTGPWSVPFPYLDANHVHVYVQGIEWSFSWTSSNTIQLPTAPANGDNIHICRITHRDARLVDYQNGAELDEATLDLDSLQLFYVMQEALDTLGKAEEIDGSVFTSRDAVIDALVGNLDRSLLTQDLLARIEYADRWYEADEIIESMSDYVEPVYAKTPLQWGITQIGVNSDNISLLTSNLEGAWSEINVQTGRIDSVVADTDGNTSIITQLANEYYVKLDANGNVSGFGLYDDAGSSQFIVNADKFAVIKSDGSGSAIVPFIFDTTKQQMGINGSLIVTGSISAGLLAADAVLAANIKAGEIDASHIDVTTLSAISAYLGTITSGTISASGMLTMGYSAGNGGTILFEGVNGWNAKLGVAGTSSACFFRPTTDDVMSLYIGGGSTFDEWEHIDLNATNDIGLLASVDSNNYGEVFLSGESPSVVLEAKNSGTLSRAHLSAFSASGRFAPYPDNHLSLGTSSDRWTAVYAVNGTIQTSDERDKERISDLTLGLDFIKKLRPVNYSWLGDTGVRQGLLAQEVEEAAEGAPVSALHYDESEDRYGINYGELVVPTIRAVQELSASLKAALSRIDKLESLLENRTK